MANSSLLDRGSRKHVLDVLEGDCRAAIDAILNGSGFSLATTPHLQPYGRGDVDAWTELEVEEYLQEPNRQIAGFPAVEENWWLAHVTENSSRPTWDLIGHLQSENGNPGILLVEAKANVTELNPTKGMSKSTGSVESDGNEAQIKKRIEDTQRILNRMNKSKIKLPFDRHFQLINRLAYSCHLAELGYHVVLVYVGFCGDTYFKDPIVDQRHWDRVMGGYIQGVVSQSFPEQRHDFESGGSLQMLIRTLPVKTVSSKDEDSMTEDEQAPDRIKPFYETPEPGEELLLIREDEATLKQADTEVKGTVKITQEWSPMGLYWEFTGSNFDAVSFGEVEIESKSFNARGRLFSQGKHRVAGYIENTVELGSDHKIDRVTFHLPNYPDFISKNDFHDEITDGSKRTSIRWNEIVLEADEWRIRLQPYRDIFALRQKARESQKVVLSGVGEIRKSDGSQFKKKKVKPLLEALRIFLSFSFAEWSPPLLVVGSNEVAEKSCQYWGNYDVSPRSYLRGWLDEHHGQHLSDAFMGFMNLWSNKNWQEPLELAVTWLIEASRQSGGTEGAIAFGQIPLEMLAWLVFVDDRTVVDADEFDKLSAASKLQMLLAHCGIPFEIPAALSTLSKIATEQQKKSGKEVSGPQLVTKIRNTIIHPNEKNRGILAEWEKTYSVNIRDIRWETQQLFKSYITLVLLRMIGYSGEYANRITPWKLGDVELVPWATPGKEDTSA